MTAKRDYYDVLSVSRDADAGTIKKEYRRLAKKYHPDSNAGNAEAEQKFKEITEAYMVLSDSEKKKLYDQFGHAAFDGSNPDPGAYENPFKNQGETFRGYHFEGGDADDIFRDIFGGRFHGDSGFGREFRRKGADLHAEVSLTFEEAAFGCDKLLTLQSPEKISEAAQTLQVHIPGGIDTGKSVRLRGKGNPGTGGAEPGDLLLDVKVGKKSGFERKGADIYTTAGIPFSVAVLGGEAKVSTLYGDVSCRIPKGTQSGTKIRLRGKGIVSVKNKDVRGDQYVSIQIQVPRNLSSEAEKKLREYEYASEQKTQRAGSGR